MRAPRAEVVAHPAGRRFPGASDEARPLVRRTVGFARLLRDNGFPIGLAEARDALAFLQGADLSDRNGMRWGLRAILTASRADWRRFDELFDAWWLGRGMKRSARVSGDLARGGLKKRQGPAGPAGSFGPPDRVERGPGAGDAAVDGDMPGGGAATGDSLARTDFRHLEDPEQMARVEDLAERLAAKMRWRLTRRERLRRRGRRLDLRHTIHRNIRHGGTPVELAFRRRRDKPVKLVLLVDVSGSMSVYATFFLRFVRALSDRFRHAEPFVFHTRLVPIGPAMREKNLQKALDRMSLIAQGFSGGTRIGESLAAFNRDHAERVLDSRSVVIIVSDGYDTGEPERLGAEMARLRRRARRVVWLNPMIGWEGYEPVARGMQAALPHVDLFAPAHNLKSVAALEPWLARL